MKLKYKFMPSPVGQLKLVVSDQALLAILWDKEKLNRVRLDEMVEDNLHPLLLETERQLNDYFKGHRKEFDLPIKAIGTPFQENIWKYLSQIPYGKTVSYKEVANHIQNPKAVRAVGSAIGRNPISIIIPCHRVLATNGTLAGFAGGLDKKRILLNLEA